LSSYLPISYITLLETMSPLIQKGPIALISKDTQAFKLFSEGKKPIEVAIRLDLKADEVDRLYQQFWKLEGLYQLNLIYKEIRRYLPSFLNLFKIMKQQKTMSEQNMAETDKKLAQLENIKNNNKDYQRLKGYLNKRLTIF
jgi:hypothetical protein